MQFTTFVCVNPFQNWSKLGNTMVFDKFELETRILSHFLSFFQDIHIEG